MLLEYVKRPSVWNRTKFGSGKNMNNSCLIKSCLINRYQRVLISRIDLGFTSYWSWSIKKKGFRQGSILGPLLFLYCINDVPKIFSNNVKSALFADDTSLIVSNHNYVEYKEDINTAFIQVNERFNSNLLILNYKKTHYVQFRAQINRFN